MVIALGSDSGNNYEHIGTRCKKLTPERSKEPNKEKRKAKLKLEMTYKKYEKQMRLKIKKDKIKERQEKSGRMELLQW